MQCTYKNILIFGNICFDSILITNINKNDIKLEYILKVKEQNSNATKWKDICQMNMTRFYDLLQVIT